MDTKRMKPRSRSEMLVVEEMPEETLVYDLERHNAHCLNKAAALVWRNCDGQRSVKDIATILHGETGIPADERVVWLALRQLGKARLLEEPVTPPPAIGNASRREVLRRLGIVGGTAVLLPLIQSIVAPTAVAAATCLPGGAACTGSGQCCSGICSGGVCVSERPGKNPRTATPK